MADAGKPADVSVKARPTIQTPIGPMRYPGEVTIIRRTVGG